MMTRVKTEFGCLGCTESINIHGYKMIIPYSPANLAGTQLTDMIRDQQQVHNSPTNYGGPKCHGKINLLTAK